MNDYKYDVGQRVSFTVPRSGCTVNFGTIVRRWWYACQGFAGFPMYDIDCGEPELAFGVDEDCIISILTPKQIPLGPQGRAQLKEELAEKEKDLKAARLTVRMLRKSIKSIKAILGQG